MPYNPLSQRVLCHFIRFVIVITSADAQGGGPAPRAIWHGKRQPVYTARGNFRKIPCRCKNGKQHMAEAPFPLIQRTPYTLPAL